MKTLKLILSISIFAAMAIVTGCSDQLTSSNQSYTKTGSGQKPGPRRQFVDEVSKNIPEHNVFTANIRLKPQRSFRFDAANTPFEKFNSYNVTITTIPDINQKVQDCRDLLLTSALQNDKYVILGCGANELSIDNLTIRNQSSKFIDLSVTIWGERRKVKYAEESE